MRIRNENYDISARGLSSSLGSYLGKNWKRMKTTKNTTMNNLRRSPKLLLCIFIVTFIGFIWMTGSVFAYLNVSSKNDFNSSNASNGNPISRNDNHAKAAKPKEFEEWMNWIPVDNATTALDAGAGNCGGQWTWCTHLVQYGPNFDQGMAAFVAGILQPRNTLEFGCGIGLYISYIQHYSVASDKDNSRFIGIEPESMMDAGVFGTEPYLATQAAMNIFEVEQSVLDSFGTFDVVFSSEVAEHIPFELHPPMIDFLVNATAKYLVFGAARASQGGTGHVANRDMEDWIADFTKAGMIHSDLLSKRLRASCWNGWDKGANTFVMINPEYHATFADFDNQFDVLSS